MNTGLCVGVALDTDGLSRSLARAGVGLGTLSSNRQSPEMPDASIGLDRLQTFERQSMIPSEIALDDIFPFLHGVHNLGKLLFVQILRPDLRVDVGVFENDTGIGRTNAVDVAERDVDSLTAGNVHTENAGHINSTLTLFVSRVGADHPDDALASDHLAMLAKSSNGCANFHFGSSFQSIILPADKSYGDNRTVTVCPTASSGHRARSFAPT